MKYFISFIHMSPKPTPIRLCIEAQDVIEVCKLVFEREYRDFDYSKPVNIKPCTGCENCDDRFKKRERYP